MEDVNVTYLEERQKRVLDGIKRAAKIMPKDPPVRNENLHKNEKEVEGDTLVGMNLKDSPYEAMSDEEKQKFIDKAESGVEWKQFQDMMEKTDTDIATDEDVNELDDNNDLFEKKVQGKYDKFVGELAVGKYPCRVKDNRNKKGIKAYFKKFQQKVSGDMYDNKIKSADIASNRLNKRPRRFYGTKFQENLFEGSLSSYDMRVIHEFLGGKYHLDGLQYNEFCKFSWVWKLFKFIVREKWNNFISNIYTGLVIKLPSRQYYGHKNLEDMMESTGGKPYTSLLTNHGINPEVMFYTKDSEGNIINLKPEYEKYLSGREYFDTVFKNSINGNIVDLSPEYEAHLKKKYDSLIDFKDKKDTSQEEKENVNTGDAWILNVVHEPVHGVETKKSE